MKKNVIIALIALLPMGVWAQDNSWEKPEVEQTTKANKDAKYLKGAVPEVNGKVVFSTTIEAPGKSAANIYDIIYKYMQKMTTEENHLSHNFLKEDKDKHELSALFEEWLVFKSSKLELDRTRMSYAFEVKCEDGRAIVTISHIRYVYDEARKAKRYVAENWITDKEALNKKGTRLTPLSRKFRRKTVDRKDFLFNKIESLLK